MTLITGRFRTSRAGIGCAEQAIRRHSNGIGRGLPERFDHAMADGFFRDVAGHPHMVQPPPAIRRRPILRPIAPPGVEPGGCRMEMAADIDPVVRRLQPAQYLALDRGMADHVKQLAMAPHIAFQRRDVEIAGQRIHPVGRRGCDITLSQATQQRALLRPLLPRLCLAVGRGEHSRRPCRCYHHRIIRLH